MKFLGFLIGAALVGLGVLFLAASAVANAKPRLIVGGILLVGGIVLILALVFRRERPVAAGGGHPGVNIAAHTAADPAPSEGSIQCRRCGAQIDPTDIRTRTREDGEFIECPHCGASFEFEGGR